MKPVLLLAPLALAVTTPALAGPFFGPPPGHPGPPTADRIMDRAEEAFDQVDATETQRSSVRTILEDTLPQVRAYHEEAGVLREQIKGIFFQSEIDRDALELARTDVVDLVDRATATLFQALADLAEVFTLEQRTELRDIREARHQEMRQRFAR